MVRPKIIRIFCIHVMQSSTGGVWMCWLASILRSRHSLYLSQWISLEGAEKVLRSVKWRDGSNLLLVIKSIWLVCSGKVLVRNNIVYFKLPPNRSVILPAEQIFQLNAVDGDPVGYILLRSCKYSAKVWHEVQAYTRFKNQSIGEHQIVMLLKTLSTAW